MRTQRHLGAPQRKGRPGELSLPDDGADLSLLDGALEGLELDAKAVIPALQRAQNVYGFLPQSVMGEIANRLKVPGARVYGVATFYAQFHLKPRGKHIILVCRGTACHVGGASDILRMLEGHLGVEEGNTTEDGQFTLETVACLGACALAPVMVIDGDYHGHLDDAAALAVIDKYASSGDGAEDNDADGN